MSEQTDVFRALLRFRDVPVLVRAFVLGTIFVASLALLGFLLGVEWDLVDLGRENNIPTWFSSVQLFTIAAILSVIVIRDMDLRKLSTWTLAVVPGMFALLSLDEVAMFHERLGRWLKISGEVGTGLRTGPWVLIFVPLVGLLTVASAIVFWPYLKGRRDVLALVVLGFAAFGLSAVGLELLANLWVDQAKVPRVLGYAEEVGEMLAANIILWSAVLVVQHEGIHIEFGTRHSR